MTDPLERLDPVALPAEVAAKVERAALQAFRAQHTPTPTWTLTLERWALQSAGWGFLGWAFTRVFAGG